MLHLESGCSGLTRTHARTCNSRCAGLCQVRPQHVAQMHTAPAQLPCEEDAWAAFLEVGWGWRKGPRHGKVTQHSPSKFIPCYVPHWPNASVLIRCTLCTSLPLPHLSTSCAVFSLSPPSHTRTEIRNMPQLLFQHCILIPVSKCVSQQCAGKSSLNMAVEFSQ